MGCSKPVLAVFLAVWLAPAQTNVNGLVSVAGTTPLFSQNNRVTISSAGQATLTGTGLGSTTLPANYFATPGTIIRFDVKGFFSTSSTPGGMQMRAMLGGTSICAATVVPPSSSQSNAAFEFEGQIVGVTAGSGGTVACGGTFLLSLQSTATPVSVGVTTATSPVTVNTTGTLAFDVQFTWGTFSSGDTITSVIYVLKTQ